MQKIELRKYCLYYSAFTKVSVLNRFLWSLIFAGPMSAVNRRCPRLRVRLYAITSDQRSNEGKPLIDSTDLRVQWFAQLLIIALVFQLLLFKRPQKPKEISEIELRHMVF